MRRIMLLTGLAALLLAAPLLADTLHLKNGQQFEGQVVRETATHVYFKIRGLGEQAFKKSDVDRIEKGETVFDQFERRRKALARGDAEGHYQLGLWCEENQLRRDAKKLFEAAVAADPDHAGARAKLDFVRWEGEWVTRTRYEAILAELAEKEAGIFASLALGDAHEDAEARFAVACPKGWKKKVLPGAVTFTGPELGGVAAVVAFDVTDLEDSLDEFAANVGKALKAAHEDLAAKGEAQSATLAKKPARLYRFTFTEDGAAKERAEILMVDPSGGYSLSIVCRDGYFEKLRPFFMKIAGSVKQLEEPPDFTSKEGGYSLVLPDETYVRATAFPINIKDVKPVAGEGFCWFVQKNAGGFFGVAPRKEALSLEDLQAKIPETLGLPQVLQLAEGSAETTVAGQKALRGALALAGGRMGKGLWAVFQKGERTFTCVYIPWMNQMGERYVKEDFNKFLAGFRLLD